MEYAEYLTPNECPEILKFVLDRFEPFLREDDGDGPLMPGKLLSCTISEAIAGMLWAFLAAAESEIRWKAAHAVRRLCLLRQREVLDALILRFGDTQATHFTDKRLPFYYMHSQLYALIALARAAREVPDFLSPYAQFFAEQAVQEPPHVLIRHFGAQAALALETHRPGIYDRETLQTLQKVNMSPYSKIKKEDYFLTAYQCKAELIIQLWVHRSSLNLKRRPLQSFDSIMEAIIFINSYLTFSEADNSFKSLLAINNSIDSFSTIGYFLIKKYRWAWISSKNCIQEKPPVLRAPDTATLITGV